jgi:hypothetical protein
MTEHISEFSRRRAIGWFMVSGVILGHPAFVAAQGAGQRPDVSSADKTVTAPPKTIQDYSLRLLQLARIRGA